LSLKLYNSKESYIRINGVEIIRSLRVYVVKSGLLTPKETCTFYRSGNKEKLRDIELVCFLSTNIFLFSDIVSVVLLCECITYFASDTWKIT